MANPAAPRRAEPAVARRGGTCAADAPAGADTRLADLRLDMIRSDFDNAAKEEAERERELNVLRDLAVEQAKRDDALLRKWIEMI